MVKSLPSMGEALGSTFSAEKIKFLKKLKIKFKLHLFITKGFDISQNVHSCAW